MIDVDDRVLPPLAEEESLQRSEDPAVDGLWLALGSLYRWRWFLVGMTLLVAGASVAISLTMPNWYAAEARVLPPESGGPGPLASALLKGGGSAASALLGGVSSDYARYLAILSSRRVLEQVVDQYDLVEVYDVADRKAPREEALRMLEGNIDFPVDENYEFLSVVVLDQDPRRAAGMANFIVAKLNEINSELSSENASTYRAFVQTRYDEAQADLDSVMSRAQAFQQRYGIMDLDVQSQAYFTQLAGMRAQAMASQIQYEALRSQLGSENTDVQMLGEVARASQSRVDEMLAGSEVVLPVARDQMSAVSRQYAELRRDATVQQQILEVVQPMLEQARFEEEKRVEAVQVVDPAVPPALKAKPRRSVIVLLATLSGFLLACLFVLAYTAWQRNASLIAARLRHSARAPARAGA